MVLINPPPPAQPVNYAAQDAEDLELLYLHSILVDRAQNGVYQGFAPVDPDQVVDDQYYWHAVAGRVNDPDGKLRMVMTKAERIDRKPDPNGQPDPNGTATHIYTETKRRNGTVEQILPIDKFYVRNAGIPGEWVADKEAEKQRLAVQRGLAPAPVANDDDDPMDEPRGQQAGRKRRTTRRGSKAARKMRKTRGKRIRRRSLKRK